MPGFVYTDKTINPLVLPSCTEAIQFITPYCSVAQCWPVTGVQEHKQSSISTPPFTTEAKKQRWDFFGYLVFWCSRQLSLFPPALDVCQNKLMFIQSWGQLPLPVCEFGIKQKPKFCSISKCHFHSGRCEVSRSHPILLEPPKQDLISTERSGWEEHT